MKPAIIFDLDGTLIHSAPDIQAAVNAMLAGEGQAPLSIATVISFIGHGLPELLRQVIDHTGLPQADHARLLDVMRNLYNADPVALTRPYANVVATLESLQAAGYPLALCTNKPEQPARDILQKLDLQRFFPVVIGGDSLPTRKPDPMMLRAAITSSGAETAIYVGDSEVDAATADAAQVPFALYTQGYCHQPFDSLPHRFRFDDFAALPAQIEALH